MGFFFLFLADAVLFWGKGGMFGIMGQRGEARRTESSPACYFLLCMYVPTSFDVWPD